MSLEIWPICLVRLGCSSEGLAENGILGRKCAFRDSYPGALVLMRHSCKNTLDYIGALGLYANVCLSKVTLSVVCIMLREVV